MDDDLKTRREISMPRTKRQKILVFDSGLGGLTVFREIRKARPDADYLYLGDDALFPYGALAPDALVARVDKVIGEAMAQFTADGIVIACHTASTLVLPPLRARYAVPIIGTVPAIKPAAALTKTGIISVLATPGTVSRDYTAELVRDFASGIDVTLVGSKHLAEYAEAALRGERIDDAEIAVEIAPAFIDGNAFASEVDTGSRQAKASTTRQGKRTDVIVLACTHYPLLMDRLEKLAPWPVTWIDPAPAIARRVVQVMGEVSAEGTGEAHAILTAGLEGNEAMLAAFGLAPAP
ncbi:MAG: glutamate racemase [Proteobacteria bacterium]|nr:glutamate racemase [Pseudomonadota bacterium]